MHELLEKITAGEAGEADLELLHELALTVKDGSLCGLGQSAPNPVLSSLEHFRHEYMAFIKESRHEVHDK
jgi:NADH:ubiquinone oxidoreductase subunit F (NADH-binding)